MASVAVSAALVSPHPYAGGSGTMVMLVAKLNHGACAFRLIKDVNGKN